MDGVIAPREAIEARGGGGVSAIGKRAVSEPRTDVYHQRFSVPFDYPVYFTRGLFRPDNATLLEAVTRLEPHRRHRLTVVIDQGLVTHWPKLEADVLGYMKARDDQMTPAAEPKLIPGGEVSKNDRGVLEDVLELLHRQAIDRQSFVLAIGGGAVLDMVGYAAAITHRGVRLIRIPTTVLAQHDSGIGVKNAVNAFDVKNYHGAFAPPFAVINDFDFLDSLEPRDKIAGAAEAVKVALVRDAAYFDWLEDNAPALARGRPGAMEHMIRRCAELHLRHIASSGDAFEFGSARPLDFGHWAAHKLETLSGYALRHGEAVAIGIALDSFHAVETGLLSADRLERICALLERLGFGLWHPALDAREPDGALEVLAGIHAFREHLGGDLTVTMLADIGRGVEVHEIDRTIVFRAIEWLRARETAWPASKAVR